MTDDAQPGYCRCCRGFHLLSRRDIPALPVPVDICRFCADLGDGEVAWRIAGVTEDGFGLDELGLPPMRGRRFPGGRRRDRVRLAESLIVDDPGGGELTGFGPGRYSMVQRVLMAWWRVRGRL